MPVAFDVAVVVNSGSSSVLTLATGTLTTAGPNELLIASISMPKTTSPITSVTGGGLTWALVRADNVGTTCRTEIWSAFATAAFSAAVTFNWTAGSSKAAAIVSAYSGTDTSGTSGSGAIGATSTSTASSASATAAITTTRAGSLVIAAEGHQTLATVTAPTGQTATSSASSGGSAASNVTTCQMRQAFTTTASGTSVTMGGTSDLSASVAWVMDAIEILAYVTPSTLPVPVNINQSVMRASLY